MIILRRTVTTCGMCEKGSENDDRKFQIWCHIYDVSNAPAENIAVYSLHGSATTHLKIAKNLRNNQIRDIWMITEECVTSVFLLQNEYRTKSFQKYLHASRLHLMYLLSHILSLFIKKRNCTKYDENYFPHFWPRVICSPFFL